MKVDPEQNIQVIESSFNPVTNTYTMKVNRKAKTSDSSDFEIKFGKEHEIVWLESNDSSELNSFTSAGSCTFNLDVPKDDADGGSTGKGLDGYTKLNGECRPVAGQFNDGYRNILVCDNGYTPETCRNKCDGAREKFGQEVVSCEAFMFTYNNRGYCCLNAPSPQGWSSSVKEDLKFPEFSFNCYYKSDINFIDAGPDYKKMKGECRAIGGDFNDGVRNVILPSFQRLNLATCRNRCNSNPECEAYMYTENSNGSCYLQKSSPQGWKIAEINDEDFPGKENWCYVPVNDSEAAAKALKEAEQATQAELERLKNQKAAEAVAAAKAIKDAAAASNGTSLPSAKAGKNL